MDKEHSGSDLNPCQDNDNSQSLVGKLKKNVTEIISNTSLSKWFRKNDSINNNNSAATVRRRQNDSDDEDFEELQPPAKRTKLPSSKETLSLNVSEVLSPISLKTTTLYKNFPESVAGPSGYESRKKLLSGSTLFPSEDPKPSTSSRIVKSNRIPSATRTEGNKELLNSDSEESTSGYSSGRVGSKEVISQESSKQVSPSQSQNSPLKNRSLFSSASSGLFSTDRSNTNSSMSSRVPSFNPSVCGSVNFADRTLASKKILNSPFYTGKTIYGGASAYGRNTQRVAEDVHKILRKSVSIKPTNTGMEKGSSCLPLGKTARRILDALEQYSSPISDAKKIPLDNHNNNNNNKKKFEGMLTRYRGAAPYTRFNSRGGGASSKELIVPSVTDLLKIKIKQQKSKLQDSTESVRQLATKTPADNSSNKEQTYQLPVYDQKDRHVRKMRNKITSVRQKTHHDINNESVPELNLTPVVLPIKELPKFDGPLFPAKKTTNSASTTDSPFIINKKTDSITNDVAFNSSSSVIVETPVNEEIQSEFKFSDPVVLANCFKSLKALNNFKFSEPLVKKRKSIHPELDLEQENRNSEFGKRSNGENSIITQPSLVNLFKPKEGTWECSECFIRNQSGDKKCVACTNPRISSKDSIASQSIPPSPITSTLQELNKKEEKQPKASSELFNKFLGTTKLPVTKIVDEWRCSICLITNKNNVTKCAACENPKPNSNNNNNNSSSFGKTDTSSINNDDNRKKGTNWNCAVCMVPNKEDAEKCVCCETRNPNIEETNTESSNKLKTSVSSFNFGIDKATASNFLFGIPQGTDHQTLPAAAAASTKTNAELVFGEKKIAEPFKDAPVSFLFGVQPEFQKQEEIKSSQPFGTTTEETATKKPTIGDNNASEKPVLFPFIAPKPAASTTTSTATTFSFGSTIPKTDNKNEEINKTVDSKLMNPSLLNTTTTEKVPEKTGEFLFGLPKAATSSAPPLPSIFGNALNKSPQKRSKPEDEAPASKIPSFNFTATTTSSSSTNGDVNKFGLEANIATSSTNIITGNSNFSFAPKTAISTISTNNTDTFFGNVTTNKAQQQSPSAPAFKFGASSNLPKPTNGFGFGSSASSIPAFGSSSSNNTDISTTSSTFGVAGGVLQKPSPQFAAFGSEPAKRTFSFAENTQQTNKSSTFFSTSQPSTTVQTPSFSFNPTQTVPQFGFQGIKPENSLFGSAAAAATVPSFAVPSTASFGNNNPTSINGTLNFGAAASNNKATFSFGANNNSSEKSGGFNFEPSSAVMNANAAASGGGFSFSAAAAGPSFNFTGGSAPASFSAPPLQDGTGTMPQRKFKKAIRRTLR